ncbi:GNAT family N-acetyltransferase [Nostoc sp. CENA67]|uniref:GNAT family N-acetyltransferase n=1 Tax=Amazonocrinis nigriterrae CENA67 TaxID=2794033 RepID=A0A8J7HMY0_9NOST|nr:GNAT family protein [Amazonocrinis nigriterrae]MBH8562618.1 GNAT family N-acetyltransferase [Amazonocrinis nigriterrae CENA67]
MEPVVTKRLIIRRLAETDLHDYLQCQTHPEILPYMPGEPITEEGAKRYVPHLAAVEIGDKPVFIVFAIQHIADAKMIGQVSINLSAKEQSQGEIGWILHPDYQGRGYATEAAQVLLNYCFAQRKLHRITAMCDTRNTASVRLMERLGMRREAHLKQSIFIQGAWRDEYIYALLRDEWLLQQEHFNESKSIKMIQ